MSNSRGAVPGGVSRQLLGDSLMTFIMIIITFKNLVMLVFWAALLHQKQNLAGLQSEILWTAGTIWDHREDGRYRGRRS